MKRLNIRIGAVAHRFKSFARKAYSAFVSMHREVSIGRTIKALCDKELAKSGRMTVGAMALAMIGVMSALASVPDSSLSDELQQLQLQEVQVLSRQTEIQSQSYRLVTEVGREVIASLPSTTIADLLQSIPGLDIRSRGTSGSQADVSMRGGTFEQVMVMLNGVNISDAQTGHYALNIPVPLSAIERIEVLEGAAASLVGGNAFTGAINIVTRKSDNDSYDISMQLGMNRLAKGEMTGSWHRNRWYILASAEYGHSNGYYAPMPSDKEQTSLDNSDLDYANIFCNVRWNGLELQLASQYKDAGAGMFYGFGSQDQFDATRTIISSARYQHSWGRWTIEGKVGYRANYDRYEWHRGQRLYGNFHFAQNTIASFKTHYASSFGKTTVGVEARNENIHSTNLGDTINPTGQVPNVTGFALSELNVFDLVRGKNRLNISYFAQQTIHVERFSASITAGGIYNTMFANQWTAGADLGYAFDLGITLFANANRSLRMPSFTDLYYNAGNQLGSRDLMPEKAWTASAGASYSHRFEHAGTLSLKAEIYHRWGRDIIDWIYMPDDSKRPYHARNQQKVNTLGVECSVQYRLNEWLRMFEISYAYNRLDIDLHESNSRYLDYLKHKLVVRLEHGIYNGVGASWMLTYRDRMGQYNNADGDVAAFRPVLLFDGKVFYDLPHWRLAVSCTNITNRHYYDYGGILQPGAWCKLTANYHFE